MVRHSCHLLCPPRDPVNPLVWILGLALGLEVGLAFPSKLCVVLGKMLEVGGAGQGCWLVGIIALL